jgi:hypothetical protein
MCGLVIDCVNSEAYFQIVALAEKSNNGSRKNLGLSLSKPRWLGKKYTESHCVSRISTTGTIIYDMHARILA